MALNARLAVLMGLLPGLVAAELLLRAVLSVFSPRNPQLEPRLTASSFVAGLLRWPPQPLLALQHELHNRFGIDLRQVWAFTYMRRAFLPVLGAVAALGWAAKFKTRRPSGRPRHPLRLRAGLPDQLAFFVQPEQAAVVADRA